MDQAVSPIVRNNIGDIPAPVFVKISHGERLTSITEGSKIIGNGDLTILAGTSQGRLLKILIKNGSKSSLLEASQVFDVRTSVKEVASVGQEWTVLVSDESVRSVPMVRCDTKRNCQECVEGFGDYDCGWDADADVCLSGGKGLGWLVNTVGDCPIITTTEKEVELTSSTVEEKYEMPATTTLSSNEQSSSPTISEDDFEFEESVLEEDASFEIPFDVFEINSRASDDGSQRREEDEDDEVQKSAPYLSCPSCVCECPINLEVENGTKSLPDPDEEEFVEFSPVSKGEDEVKVNETESEEDLFRRQQKRLDVLLGLIEQDGESDNDIDLEEKGEIS